MNAASVSGGGKPFDIRRGATQAPPPEPLADIRQQQEIRLMRTIFNPSGLATMPGSPSKLLMAAAAGLLLAGALTLPLPLQAGTGPTLQLFPTTVLEDIRETGQVAQEMEMGLQDVIARMDQQQALYVESKCDGAENDPGCQQIARQLGATYLEMLNIMSERLPDMERAVNSTRDSLENRLRRELGQKMTPWDMQEMLLGNAASTAAREQPSLRGRSGMRLSDRFARYYNLVAHSGTTSSNSLAVIASDIYLDMDQASVLIAKTRDEINRAALMEQLNQSFGQLTPDMELVVTGVKSILFGESALDLPIADGPPLAKEEVYRSPLEM
jgi:hypothetical protein